MSERELLELAEKAAGHIITGWRTGRRNVDWAELSDTSTWNPREDDGDAMRLAVKLRLSPMMRTLGCDTTDLNGTAGAYEKWGGDPHAATRRAIVRAAAEIGRQMQEGGAA